MVRRADSGGGREAAIHSGLDSALGSHPCVALSSYQAPPLYGGCPNIAQQKSSTLEENCDKSWGGGGDKPPKGTATRNAGPSPQIPPETAEDIKSTSPSLQLMSAHSSVCLERRCSACYIHTPQMRHGYRLARRAEDKSAGSGATSGRAKLRPLSRTGEHPP